MTRYKSSVLFVFIILALALNACKLKNTASVSPYGGFYLSGDTLKEGPYGEVSIYPTNDSVALFHLYVNKGAPSYNSGEIAKHITISNGKAVFRKNLPYTLPEKVSSKWNVALKCPFIIKTSNGDLELLPNEKLLLHHE